MKQKKGQNEETKIALQDNKGKQREGKKVCIDNERRGNWRQMYETINPSFKRRLI